MKYTITIPEPCHENWGSMTETAKGKFCDSCKKEVVDFTNTSVAMLSRKLDSGSKICGRFRPDQLNRSIRSSKGHAIRQRGVLVAAVALLTGISPVIAQSQEPAPVNTQQTALVFGKIAVHPKQETIPVNNEFVSLRGTVRSGQSLLIGADIRIKGTDIKTKTDLDGTFEILVKAEKLDGFVILQVSAIDHETREVQVQQVDAPIAIDLFYNGFIMGDIIIEEQPNIIDRIGSGFKKRGKAVGRHEALGLRES